jgi:hypothetical protein
MTSINKIQHFCDFFYIIYLFSLQAGDRLSVRAFYCMVSLKYTFLFSSLPKYQYCILFQQLYMAEIDKVSQTDTLSILRRLYTCRKTAFCITFIYFAHSIFFKVSLMDTSPHFSVQFKIKDHLHITCNSHIL